MAELELQMALSQVSDLELILFPNRKGPINVGDLDL